MSTIPVIHVDDIQGDILLGSQKIYERIIFFTITDAPSFKKILRTDNGPLI